MDVFISPLGSPEKPYSGLDSVWIGSRRRLKFPWSEKAVVIFFAFVSHFSEVKRRTLDLRPIKNDVGTGDDVASKLR